MMRKNVKERRKETERRRLTDATVVGVFQLTEEDIGPPLNVRCRRTNERMLLRSLHHRPRQASLSPEEGLTGG
jgi:hypothetical protein